MRDLVDPGGSGHVLDEEGAEGEELQEEEDETWSGCELSGRCANAAAV